MSPKTVPWMIENASKNYKNHTALVFKNNFGEWNRINYEEYFEKIEKTAKVFIKLGLKRGGVVAVFGSNSVEWFISELATISAG
jgi:long-subunit acyl-CoA synthetase (AMP-forming)